MNKLSFGEKETLKSVAIDADLYKRIKDKLEEDPITLNFTLSPHQWDGELGSFVIKF